MKLSVWWKWENELCIVRHVSVSLWFFSSKEEWRKMKMWESKKIEREEKRGGVKRGERERDWIMMNDVQKAHCESCGVGWWEMRGKHEVCVLYCCAGACLVVMWAGLMQWPLPVTPAPIPRTSHEFMNSLMKPKSTSPSVCVESN